MKKNLPARPVLPLFRQFIAACQSGRRRTTSGKKLAPGTLNQYRCVYHLLQQFEEITATPLMLQPLKTVSPSQLQKEKRYWQQFFRQFCRFLYHNKSCFDAYCAAVCKVLRTFFRYLQGEKSLPLGPFYRLFRVPQQNQAPVVVPPELLRFLISNEAFEHSLPPHLRRTRDIFVFGCTVGLRYSDLMHLRKEHLQVVGNQLYLHLHTQKTQAEVTLPLPTYLLQVVERYRRRAGRYLLPRLSNTNFNLQVKQLLERAGWTQPLPRVRYREGLPVEIKKAGKTLRFCDQVTAHTMRRTAITTLLMLGVPEAVVRRLSGHAPGSREFYRYVVVAQDYMNHQLLEAYEKLMQDTGCSSKGKM